MNYFEQELRKLAKFCEGIQDPVFAGRACYADLGGDNRMKLEFATGMVADHYSTLRATILNRSEGVVDISLFRFSDVWGKKQVDNRNFQSGIIPYIWTYQGKSEWYVYQPNNTDFKQLAAEVSGYIGVFSVHDRVPERKEPESVVGKIREQTKAPSDAPPKTKRKKAEQEL